MAKVGQERGSKNWFFDEIRDFDNGGFGI